MTGAGRHGSSDGAGTSRDLDQHRLVPAPTDDPRGVAAVLALHRPVDGPLDSDDNRITVCDHCIDGYESPYEYPCPTVKALGVAVSDRAGTAPTDQPPTVETVTEWQVTADIPSGGDAAEEFLFERDAVWQAVRWHECGWFNVHLFSRSVEITRRESEWELVQRGNGDEGSAS